MTGNQLNKQTAAETERPPTWKEIKRTLHSPEAKEKIQPEEGEETHGFN